MAANPIKYHQTNMFHILYRHKVVRIATIMFIIGLFFTIFSGFQITKTRKSIQEARSYAAAGQDVQLNFEENLRSYQETHQAIINSIKQVRPAKEEIIVPFINTLEKIGRELKLEVEITNLETNKEELAEEVSSFIKYNISFNASLENSIAYLQEIETMPYMIKISSFNFKNLAAEEEKETRKNTSIRLNLYTADEK